MAKKVHLARKNLFHNKKKLLAALAGVSFSVILVNMQVGILTGMLSNASAFIDRLPNELWVMPIGTANFDQAQLLNENVVYRVRGVEGIEWAEKFICSWTTAKAADGGTELVQVIGFPPGGKIKIPWKTDPPEAADMIDPNGVIIDRAEQARLRVKGLGIELECNDIRVKVTGFTNGMRSFTTSPYVVARYSIADRTQVIPGRSQYVIVKVKDGVPVHKVQDDLRKQLDNAWVLTSGEFRFKTYMYWLFGTGVGTAFLMAAGLGFVVGGAVVAQVLYASVVEQQSQFGVMKAMGAKNFYLVKVVVGQSILTALVGYSCGFALTMPLKYALLSVGTPIMIPWWLVAGGFGAVFAVCLLASILPISQLLKLEPAMVFRG